MKARREDADAATAVDDDDGNDLDCFGGGNVVHAKTVPHELSIRNDDAIATAAFVILMMMVQWMSSISMIGFFLF